MNTIYFNEVSRKTFVHDCMPTAHYFIKTTSLPRLFIIYLFYVFAPLKKKHSNFNKCAYPTTPLQEIIFFTSPHYCL